MNLIGTQQRIYLKFLQWRRSTGQAQCFFVASIILREELQAHFQLYNLDHTQGFISLIDKWQIFILEYPKT